MVNKVVEFTTEWRLVPTTCEPCVACNDIIYGKQYQLFFEPGGATKVILCEPCRTNIEDESDDESFDINIS